MPRHKDNIEKATVTFRAPVSVIEQLDELCRFTGIKRSEFLIAAITSEYDRIQGNPQVKKVLEELRRVSEILNQGLET